MCAWVASHLLGGPGWAADLLHLLVFSHLKGGNNDSPLLRGRSRMKGVGLGWTKVRVSRCELIPGEAPWCCSLERWGGVPPDWGGAGRESGTAASESNEARAT